ncbi:MAG: hypothetical protein CMP10_03745 [Zetaproteobacteria bacterium]|nr:hypothetical protein [Pseudobdellovibrionaceae bacterium]
MVRKKESRKKSKGKQFQKIDFEVDEENAKFADLIEDWLDNNKINMAEAESEENTKSSKGNNARHQTKSEVVIDLHGMKLNEAISAIDTEMVKLRKMKGIVVKVITGKGLHSSGQAVLPVEIHKHVEAKYGHIIKNLDDSPDSVRIGGLPIRGFFTFMING